MLLLLLLLLPAPVNVLSDVNGATMQLHTITRLTVVTNSVGCRPFLAPQNRCAKTPLWKRDKIFWLSAPP
jgi:hypothetical protein